MPLRRLDRVSAALASALRLGAGRRVGRIGARPEEPLELYEFAACPRSRRVREALSALDLDAMIYPCPRGGTIYRPLVRDRGGREQFPYLVDPNKGVELYDADAIVRHLFRAYGGGGLPTARLREQLRSFASPLASAARLGRGRRRRPARAPGEPLELFAREGSPDCIAVTETLCSLELPYRLRTVARGSAKRPSLVARAGADVVPYLADPNTGTEASDPAHIIAYLEHTYAEDIPPVVELGAGAPST